MTKKHFIRLAEYIREAKQYTGAPFSKKQIEHLANFCHEQNSDFNRCRWIDYIEGKRGPNGGRVQ